MPCCGLPQLKPHDFRRFVGTELAKRNLRQAQRALGHQRLETTVLQVPKGLPSR